MSGEFQSLDEFDQDPKVPHKSSRRVLTDLLLGIPKTISTSTHRLSSADDGAVLMFTHVDGCAVVCPEETLRVGFSCLCLPMSVAGDLIYSKEGSDLLLSSGALESTGQYSLQLLLKLNSTTWFLKQI